VHFTQGAQDAWHKFEESHGAESQCPKFPDYLRGPWRKLTSYCARFALILQMARYAAGEASCGEVDETSLAGAIRLVEYFKSHARKVYGHLRREPSNERMAILMEWVNRHGGEVSVREVVTAKVAGCKTNGEALELFSRLRQAGVGAIQAVKNPKGGRPKIVFSLRKAD